MKKTPAMSFAAVLSFVFAPLVLGCAAEAGGAAPEVAARPDLGAAPASAEIAVVAASGGHTEMGIPADGDDADDYLMSKSGYALSYNPARRVANWVSWNLRAAHLGTAARQDDFRSDDTLPSGMYRVKKSDYLRSGYDRGHMVPSAERTRTEDENSLTFLFTNIQPQMHALNGGPWEKLETYERDLARTKQRELYIVAGGIFTDDAETIGNGVAVPAWNFKIVVSLPAGQGAADVTASTPLIAVMMPNVDGIISRRWQEYQVSVDAIEAATGYDFLSALPVSLQQTIEPRVSAIR